MSSITLPGSTEKISLTIYWLSADMEDMSITG